MILSHSSADRSFAAKLADTLRRHGIPVWYSDTDLRGGQQWHDEIGEALQRCDWFAVVLSPDAVAAKWVKEELLYSLGKVEYNGKIVPILYRSCSPEKLSWTLPQIQMVDFRGDFDAGCRELLRIWGIGYTP